MKKILISIVFGLILSPFILVGTTLYQVNFFESGWEEKTAGDCLMVLGSKVLQDNTPDLMMHERVSTAVNFITDQIKYIILTGGTVDEISTEAEVLKALLMERGIDEKKMIVENRSTSTYQNLLYSKPVISQIGCENVDIVSHDFHLARVKMTAEKLEIPVNRYIPAQTDKPNSKERLSREYLAYLWYWLGWNKLEK